MKKYMTAALGGILSFLLIGSRKQSSLLGETAAQASERDEQAVKAFREIMNDVRSDNVTNLLNQSGLSTANLVLETLDETAPELSGPMKKALFGYQIYKLTNALPFNAFNNLFSSNSLSALSSSAPSHSTMSLSEQLEAIGFDVTQVPSRFQDSSTKRLMEDPIEAKTTILANGKSIETNYLYDRATFEQLKGTCPQTQQPFIEFRAREDLQAQIQHFVEQKVKDYAERSVPSLR